MHCNSGVRGRARGVAGRGAGHLRGNPDYGVGVAGAVKADS